MQRGSKKDREDSQSLRTESEEFTKRCEDRGSEDESRRKKQREKRN